MHEGKFFLEKSQICYFVYYLRTEDYVVNFNSKSLPGLLLKQD